METDQLPSQAAIDFEQNSTNQEPQTPASPRSNNSNETHSHQSNESLPMRFSHRSDLLNKLRNALNSVQHKTFDFLETSKRKSIESLNNARAFFIRLDS